MHLRGNCNVCTEWLCGKHVLDMPNDWSIVGGQLKKRQEQHLRFTDRQ